MKLISTSLVMFLGSVATVARAAAGDVQVLSNKMGETKGYANEAVTWHAKNQPTLPANYAEDKSFIYYAPIAHYLDAVNWSLIPYRQFAEIKKSRWVRVPDGKKIERTPDGRWHWPLGSETAKYVGAKVKGKDGQPLMRDMELRLARKIADTGDLTRDWAMATYIRPGVNEGDWQLVTPPRLAMNVEGAMTPEGTVRTVTFNLTATEACMTCHAQASNSTVDRQRGNEFVYGANDELLTGRTRLRLSQWVVADPHEKDLFKEIGRNAGEDWVDVELKDKSGIKGYREAFGAVISGDLPLLTP